MPIRSQILTAMLAAATLAAAANAQDFERTISASSATDLYVSTGSGRIHIYPGSDSEVHIKGHVHAGWNAGGDIEERMHKIAANPPINQSGKDIRIGDVSAAERRLYNNITIDYEISTPKGVALDLRSGSGDVEVDNVGRFLKSETGSGSIRAHGIAGPSDLHTGSGDIELQQQGSGEVHAATGSGSIRINGLSGALTARTGSGDIEANGNLGGPSKLQTGSGSIRAHVGHESHLSVDATTGSGSIHIAGTSSDHHHLSAPINGGGPSLEAHTGSGDIEIN
jgi:Putative adhesin